MASPNEIPAPTKPQKADCNPRLVRDDVFGWYDDETQTVPAYDPRPNGICAVCAKPTGRHGDDNPLVTISLAIHEKQFRNRSYFFRAHKHCWDGCEDQGAIESALIDAVHGKDHPGQVLDMVFECKVCGRKNRESALHRRDGSKRGSCHCGKSSFILPNVSSAATSPSGGDLHNKTNH
jgi:hypothetical protein